MRNEGAVMRAAEELRQQALAELAFLQCEALRDRLYQRKGIDWRMLKLLATSFASGAIVSLWLSILL